MEEKNRLVEEYIRQACEYLKEIGKEVSIDSVNEIRDIYLNSSKSFEEIKEEIDELIRTISNDVLEFYDVLDTPLEYHGLTLNNQVIDLMMISSSNTPSELNDALSRITNVRLSLNALEMSDDDFVIHRQRVFERYMESLTSRNEYNANPNIDFNKRIQYLFNSGVLSSGEQYTLNNILSSSSSYEEIIDKINFSFGDKSTLLYQTIKSYTPIEKTGIKVDGDFSSEIEKYRNLYEYISSNSCNSITIDEEAKYQNIVLWGGTVDFSRLDKAIDFCKKIGNQVRLNTILFYMDCPERLYNLEKNAENKQIVKDALIKYVDAITKHVQEKYPNDVRSIDVFNELLNRFSLSGDIPYMYRGDIEQNRNMYGDFDNVASGWLKHLDINDLCDAIAVARRNLPNTDFMYNDDQLTDSRKIPATEQLFRQIRSYEENHGIKLVDSIGTQMHLDNDVSENDIRNMFLNLSRLGLPIEITEFDIAMTSNIDNLTNEQIELLRQQKIDQLYEAIVDLRDKCDIRGFTAWSLTDKQNFRVNLANMGLIVRGEQPISSLHGGIFTESMESKTKYLRKKHGIVNNTEMVNNNTMKNNEKKSFDRRSKTEEEIGITLQQKNHATALQRKQEHLEKSKENKQLVLTNNNQVSGFASLFFLALTTGFVAGIGTMIIYLMIR